MWLKQVAEESPPVGWGPLSKRLVREQRIYLLVDDRNLDSVTNEELATVLARGRHSSELLTVEGLLQRLRREIGLRYIDSEVEAHQYVQSIEANLKTSRPK